MAWHALDRERERWQPELVYLRLTAELGIGPGGKVIVPPYTFIAPSFSVYQAGAAWVGFRTKMEGRQAATCLFV